MEVDREKTLIKVLYPTVVLHQPNDDGTDSLPLPPPPSPPSSPQPTNNPETTTLDRAEEPTKQLNPLEKLKKDIDNIKKDLKKKSTYVNAISQLLGLMKTHLIYETKKLFYDAMQIVSYRAGKPGFDLAVAKPLFDEAYSRLHHFSTGYRRNIQDWKETVDLLIENPNAIDERTDGRFGSVNYSANRPFYTVSLSPHFRPFGGYYSSSCSSSDDDEAGDRIIGYFDGYPITASGERKLFQEKKIETSYPYHKICTPILTPIELEHTNTNASFKFPFNITAEQYQKVKDANLPFIVDIRCLHKGIPFQAPQGVQFRINDSLVDIPQEKASPRRIGYDISSLIQEGRNLWEIIVSNCVCSFSFGINLSEQHSVEQLRDKVLENHSINHEEAFERVKSSFSTDQDIEELSLRISLRCPLSQTRIQHPSRGKNCKHLQCFELESYLIINKNHPTFKCPVCSKVVPYEDLVVDGYMQQILKETDEETDEVDVNPDGKWVLPQPKQSIEKGSSSEGQDSPPIKRRKINSSPFAPIFSNESGGSHPQPPKKVDVIDLT